jgi:hypothetical protein
VIKDEKIIQVESLGERDASYNDFLRDLQKAGEAESRYLTYRYGAEAASVYPDKKMSGEHQGPVILKT